MAPSRLLRFGMIPYLARFEKRDLYRMHAIIVCSIKYMRGIEYVMDMLTVNIQKLMYMKVANLTILG